MVNALVLILDPSPGEYLCLSWPLVLVNISLFAATLDDGELFSVSPVGKCSSVFITDPVTEKLHGKIWLLFFIIAKYNVINILLVNLRIINRDLDTA